MAEMEVSGTGIGGLSIIRMKSVSDERGTVREFFRESAFAGSGMRRGRPWRQVNVTETEQGALRGLHAEQMDKLVAVVSGEAFAAYLDLRDGSPTRGRVHTVVLEPGIEVMVPSGVANGFQATAAGSTHYLYCFDAEWAPAMPGTAVTPLDPDLAIPWPIPVDPEDRSQISEKDRLLPTLAQLEARA